MRCLAVTFALCLALASSTVQAQVAKTAADGFCKSITHCGGADKDVTCVCQSGCSKQDGTPIAQCQSNVDCAEDRACVGHRCVDPCAGQCGQNTDCHVTDHAHYCRCSHGYKGDPKAGCTPAEPEACRSHKHCAEDEACVDNICVDPCEFTNCGYGSVCKVLDHQISCISTPQYSSGNVVGCQTHEDCESQFVCVVNKCVNPCSFGVCAQGEECSASNHKVFCLGNYYSPTSTGLSKCESDSDCPSNRKCDDGVCIDPCAKGWCSPNTCSVVNHTMVCQTECIPPDKINKCLWDDDCPTNKKCDDLGKCVNPCLDPDECGPDATCDVINHETTCTPKEEVIKRCKDNEHCPENLQCDGQKCFDPCEKNECAEGIECKVVNHTAVCDDKEKVKGECSKDSECAEDKACRSEKCVDPCDTSDCGEGATCEVTVHEPLCKSILDPVPRNCTTSKECPPDRLCDGLWCIHPCDCQPCGIENTCSVVENKVVCTPITPEGGCKTNEDCPSNQTCKSLACVDPCSLSEKVCKDHQLCKIENHQLHCKNKPNTECSNDFDCANEKACVDWRCVNPCLNDTCGPNYVCEPSTHIAICNPKQDERTKCSSSSDCVSDRLCLQGFCEDPCKKFCKSGSSCNVIDHVYTCGGGGNVKSGNCSGTLFPKPVGKKRYYAIADYKLNWWGAYEWCAAHGKQLATVESQEENEQILKVIEKTKVKNGKFYIGGADIGYEKHWMWTPTGLPIVKFNYWHKDRPFINLYYNCLAYGEFLGTPGYRWFDTWCTETIRSHNFICQDYDNKCQHI